MKDLLISENDLEGGVRRKMKKEGSGRKEEASERKRQRERPSNCYFVPSWLQWPSRFRPD